MRTALAAFSLASMLAGCASEASKASSPPEPERVHAPERLFDVSKMGSWRSTSFGGEGELVREAERVVLELGNPLTGITWTGGELPRDRYALELRAAKLAGHDFFCGLTFPIGDGHASLILGGWGGTTCGLSCIDGKDASENETTSYHRFEPDVLYRVRIEVHADRVRALLDGDLLFDVAREQKRFSVRGEVERSQPLGFAAFATRAALYAIDLERELLPLTQEKK